MPLIILRSLWESTTTVVEADGAATGTSTVTGIGAATFAAVGTSSGVASVVGTDSDTFSTVGSAIGTSTVLGLSTAFYSSVGAATGIATVTGISGAIAGAVGNAAGQATVLGESEGATAAVPTPVVVRGRKLGRGIGFPYHPPFQVEPPKRKPAIKGVEHPTPYELAKERKAARLARESELTRLAEAEAERLAQLAREKAEREARAQTTAAIRKAKLPKIKAAKGVAHGTCTVVAFSIEPPIGFAEISEDEFMVLAMAA